MDYYLGVFQTIGVHTLLGLSAYILLLTGQVSMAQIGFFAIGAYSWETYAKTWSVPFGDAENCDQPELVEVSKCLTLILCAISITLKVPIIFDDKYFLGTFILLWLLELSLPAFLLSLLVFQL